MKDKIGTVAFGILLLIFNFWLLISMQPDAYAGTILEKAIFFPIHFWLAFPLALATSTSYIAYLFAPRRINDTRRSNVAVVFLLLNSLLVLFIINQGHIWFVVY